MYLVILKVTASGPYIPLQKLCGSLLSTNGTLNQRAAASISDYSI